MRTHLGFTSQDAKAARKRLRHVLVEEKVARRKLSGHRLREARLACDSLGAHGLARLIGVAEETILDAERGEEDALLTHVLALSEATGESVGWLLGVEGRTKR